MGAQNGVCRSDKLAQISHIRFFPHCHQNGVCRNVECSPFLSERPAAAAVVGRPKFHFAADQLFDGFIRSQRDIFRSGQKTETHPLFLCFPNFIWMGRHFRWRSAVKDRCPASQTNRRTGGIDGRVAAADHHHLFAERNGFSSGHLFEQEQGAYDPAAGQVFRQLQGDAPMRAGGQKHIIECFRQGCQCHIFTDFRTELQVDAHAGKAFEFRGNHLPGQAISGNTQPQNTAWQRFPVEYRDCKTHKSGKIGRRHAGRTGTDNSQPFSVVCRQLRMGGFRRKTISDKSLQLLDTDAIIENIPVAGPLAEFEADPAQDCRKRFFALKMPVGFFEFLSPQQFDPAFDVVAGRTRILTGWNLVFVDGLDETPGAGFIVEHVPKRYMHRGDVAIRFKFVFHRHFTAFFRRHTFSSFPPARFWPQFGSSIKTIR